MEPLPLNSPEPGTLLWVGPTAHGEFADAYRFCRSNVAQMAVRKSLAEALRRPAGHVCRVIFARPTRQSPRQNLWRDFRVRYTRAEMIALCSSLCDGEGRTGTPWPEGGAIRFSRWDERLPRWLSPCGGRSAASTCGQSLLVISDRFETAEAYLDWGSAVGTIASWHRRFVPALHRGFDIVLWDDSAAPAATAAAWRQRLGEPVNPLASPNRHLWLTLQPSIEAIHQALAGGITTVLTKPATIESLMRLA